MGLRGNKRAVSGNKGACGYTNGPKWKQKGLNGNKRAQWESNEPKGKQKRPSEIKESKGKKEPRGKKRA